MHNNETLSNHSQHAGAQALRTGEFGFRSAACACAQGGGASRQRGARWSRLKTEL